MKQPPNEKELKELLVMVKDFEMQMKEQLETAREIAIKYDKSTRNQQTSNKLN